MRSTIIIGLAAGLAFVSAFSAQGQVPPPPPIVVAQDDEIRFDTQLVGVPVTVTDRTGKPVLELTKKNFVVYEDGTRQEIEAFTATDQPFEVALLLDTSGSTRSELLLIRRAASLFLDSLREGDRVAIMAFTTERDEDPVTGRPLSYPAVEILTKLTDDRVLLRKALDRVGTSNGTPYFDSLVQVAEEVFRETPSDRFRGRRALVALTDGVDSTSVSDFAEASELIAQTGVAAYFIKIDTRTRFEDGLLGDCESSTQFSKAQLRRYYNLFPKEFEIERVSDFCRLGDFERLDISKRLYALAEEQMQTMAKASGGRVIPVGDLSEARGAFRKVAEDIGTSYSLGYYSTNTNFDGRFRKITVELKGLPPDTVLRARDGYRAPKK